jgi:hypothetical protein
MDRSNHYESAFEAFLQEQRLPYVAVDEARRSYLGDETLKSLDFIVHGPAGAGLLVDIKGRRFPGGPEDRPRPVWESWAANDDVRGLECWVQLFGPNFRGLLVFTYEVQPTVSLPAYTDDLWEHRGRRYLLRAVEIGDYRRFMRVRSPRWGTVALPRQRFRELVRPFSHFLDPAGVAEDIWA